MPALTAGHRNSPSCHGKTMASCCRLDLVYSFNPPDQLTDQAFAAASFARPNLSPAFEAGGVFPLRGFSLCYTEPGMFRSPRRRNFSHRGPFSQIVSPRPTIARKVPLTCRPNSLHARPRFSNRADQESRGRRDVIRNTRGAAARNEIDFATRAQSATCCRCETPSGS